MLLLEESEGKGSDLTSVLGKEHFCPWLGSVPMLLWWRQECCFFKVHWPCSIQQQTGLAAPPASEEIETLNRSFLFYSLLVISHQMLGWSRQPFKVEIYDSTQIAQITLLYCSLTLNFSVFIEFT